MNIGPKNLEDADTMFGPYIAIPMLMLLKKHLIDNEHHPIHLSVMSSFVDEFNNPNYKGNRPEIQWCSNIKNVGSVNITFRMVGTICYEFEKTKRISDGSYYWIYRFEGFFVPLEGTWGNKRYNLTMRRIVLKHFGGAIYNGSVHLLRGVINQNKKQPHTSKIEFHKIENFDYGTLMNIINKDIW